MQSYIKSQTTPFVSHFWIKLFLILSQFYGCCFASPSQEETKTILITSASGELGSATAKLLARDHHLILTGRNLSRLQQLQKELSAHNPFVYKVSTVDYSNARSIVDFKNYLNKIPSVSGIVLITPRPQFYGKGILQEEDAWLEVFRSTFTGPLEVLKAALPQLSQNGKIVIVAGTTSVQFSPEAGPACVIRRMWTTYSKALSYQLGPQGICVNTLSPGVVLTKFHQDRIQNKAQENATSYEDQMKQEVSSIPLRRHAQPQEVAKAIKFLLTEESDFISGINLILDGGLTLSY